MPVDLWLTYVATCVVVLAIPGPTILLVLSYSISQGRRATIPLVAGVALGDSVAITLSMIGLGTLLANSATWFMIIKWLGGLYLVFLGLRLLMTKTANTVVDCEQPQKSARRLFASAFIVTALNPKSIIFFIALLPQFIRAGHPVEGQLIILGITFVTLAICGATSYAMFASSVRSFLSSPCHQKYYHLGGGSLLCGAGIWALTAKRLGSLS